MEMSSDFNFTMTSWFLGNVHIKPISTHNAPPPTKNADVLNRWSLTFIFDNYGMITALIQLKSAVKLSNNLQKYISEMDLNVICTFVEKKSIWLANVALTNLISKMLMKWIVIFVMKITNYFLNHCFRQKYSSLLYFWL